MKALIIDDSRLARNELKRLLNDFDFVQVIGEASNATEAAEKIESDKPDVIFLDIQMPGKNGFELLEGLETVPQVIFTTAYDQYAIKAFEVNALDYLQKPVEKERLAAAVNRVVEKKNEDENKSDSDYLRPSDQVFVKDGDRCWFVTLAQVPYMEVDGNYTKIFFEDQRPMVPRTLNYLESRLDPKYFFRANRRQIINLSWIERNHGPKKNKENHLKRRSWSAKMSGLRMVPL